MRAGNRNLPDRKILGIGWRFPVRIDARGGLSFSSFEQNVQESIWIILATARGERQMLPRFGCGMHDFVFAPNNSATLAEVAQTARDALTEWEPRIDVLSVRAEATAEEPEKLLLRVDYRLRSNNSFQNLVYPFFIREGGGA
jgi:phage baseplate assembly protein W